MTQFGQIWPNLDHRLKEALKNIDSVSMLITPSDPPPYYERLRLFFFHDVFGLLGLFGTLWKLFCKILS